MKNNKGFTLISLLPAITRRSCKGFTLIELLVAIAILVILSSIIILVLGSVMKDNRDQQRLRDLTSIKQALEFYRSDHGYYPETLPDTGGTLVVGGKIYLDNMPGDPVHGRAYNYTASGCDRSRCTGFVICASKERSGNFYPVDECSGDMGLKSD